MTQDERDKLRGLAPQRQYPIDAQDRWGHHVRCDRKTYDDKIDPKHQIEHFLDSLEETVRDPDQVNFSLQGGGKMCYYRRFQDGDRTVLAALIVRWKNAKVGDVVSGYPRTGIPPKEVMFWKRGQP